MILAEEVERRDEVTTDQILPPEVPRWRWDGPFHRPTAKRVWYGM